MVIESNDEQVQVAGGARDGGDLLLVAIEYSLPGKREPISILQVTARKEPAVTARISSEPKL